MRHAITACLALGFTSFSSMAQEEPTADSTRIFELSTRGLPLSGTLNFLNAEGATLRSVSIVDERYYWCRVPAEATQFQLTSSLDDEGPVTHPLFETGSTFANVNPTRPVVAAQSASTGTAPDVQRAVLGTLTRAPLVEEPRSYTLEAAGSTGWIFVGRLMTAADESEWTSLYLAKTDTLQKPDADQPYPYASLRAAVASEDAAAKTFVADFPLIMRPTATEEGRTGFPILRAGQTFEIRQVVRQEDNVRAEIVVR